MCGAKVIFFFDPFLFFEIDVILARWGVGSLVPHWMSGSYALKKKIGAFGADEDILKYPKPFHPSGAGLAFGTGHTRDILSKSRGTYLREGTCIF